MRMLAAVGAFVLAASGWAYAADLPLPGPLPRAAYVPAITPYSWGGLYVGANGGYGFGSSNWTDSNNPFAQSTGDFHTSGFLLGGTAGANFQAGAWVLGVEADIDWSTIKGSITPDNGFCNLATGPTAVSATCETKNKWLGTGRVRLGYAIDRVLLFATGGAAFGDVAAGLTGVGAPGATAPTGPFQGSTVVGWTAGAGVEVAFAPNWTAKLEYLFINLGNVTCNQQANCGIDAINIVSGTFTPANDTVKFSTNLVRFGINYQFGPW